VLPCLSGQQFFYPFPRLVAYIVPVNAFIFFHASILPLFPYPVHTAYTEALFCFKTEPLLRPALPASFTSR
jgi:hypothetical protein